MLLVDARHGLKQSDREFMRLMDEYVPALTGLWL